MGSVANNKSAIVDFKIPELRPTLEMNWGCDIMEDMPNTPYNMIIGCDVLKEFKIGIHSSNLTWVKPVYLEGQKYQLKSICSTQVQTWMMKKYMKYLNS